MREEVRSAPVRRGTSTWACPTGRSAHGIVASAAPAGRVARRRSRRRAACRRATSPGGCASSAPSGRSATYVPVARSTRPHLAAPGRHHRARHRARWSRSRGRRCSATALHQRVRRRLVRHLGDPQAVARRGLHRRGHVLAVARDHVAGDALHLVGRVRVGRARLAGDVVLGLRRGDVGAADARRGGRPVEDGARRRRCLEKPMVIGAARRTVAGWCACRARRRSRSTVAPALDARDEAPRLLVGLPAAGGRRLAGAQRRARRRCRR